MDYDIDEIFDILGDQEYLTLVQICVKKPVRVLAIQNEIERKLNVHYKISTIGKWVRYLESMGIIKYTDKGWVTDHKIEEVIEKYFT